MGNRESSAAPGSPSPPAWFARSLWMRLAILVALIALPGLLGAVAAQARSFEGVGHFAGILPPTKPPKEVSEFPEEVQLGGVGGMAVNSSGAGGVEPGTLYAAVRGPAGDTRLRIVMYEPEGGGLAFVERWDVLPTEKPYERCGPLLGTACAPKPESVPGSVAVEVDQASGDVYVFSVENLAAGDTTVTVFKPDGSEVRARFAELAPGGVTTAATPELVHNSPAPGGMARAADGTVYLFDVNSFDNFYHRLMAFREATPGDPTTYEYVEGGDLGAGFLGKSKFPSMPQPGPGGSVYVAGYEGDYVQKYEPTSPVLPVCEFTFAKGGLSSMTVDPQSGEVFFFSYKDKRIHRLSPCSGGKMSELGTIAVGPQRDDLYALAFDPARKFESGREAGVLYGGAPGPVPSTGGKGEPGMGALGYIFAPVLELDPVVESEAVSSVGPTSARLEAEVNPKGPPASYQFQYLTDAAYAANTHHPAVTVKATGGKFTLSFGGDTTAELQFDASAAQVEAALAGLGSIGPGNVAVSGGPGDETGSSPYLIDFALGVGDELPLLAADGSKLGGAGASAEVGGYFAEAGQAPAAPAVLGDGTAPLHAAAFVGGLAPDTSYRYRAIATSNCSPSEPERTCEGVGAAESFRTYPVQVAGPPDGRAYELVSPSEKHGGQVLPTEPSQTSCIPVECKPGDGYTHFPMQSAPSGDTVVYEGTPFGEGGAVIENEYLARRGPSGWTTANLTPPLLQSKGGLGYKAFDANLTGGLLEQVSPPLSPEAPPDFTNLYRQPTADPSNLTPLLTSGNAFIHRVPFNGAGSLKLTYAGASDDLARVFFEANDALTSEAGEPGEAGNLFESSGAGLRQVNLAPAAGEPLPGAVFGSGELLESGSSNIKVAVFTHAFSDDGTRVFWTGADGATYVRIGGGETLEVPGPGGCKEGVALALRTCFLAASADGGRVLLSNGQIYALNEEAGAYEPTVDLAAGQGGFEGIAGQSEDLTSVYFVDTAVLTGEEENNQGAKAQAGKHNLYTWVEGETSFVATLSQADNGNPGDWQASPAVRTAEASPAGRYLAFASTAPLTGYDNVGPCQFIDNTKEYEDVPCREVFLYDSATGELTCPSCNPSGAPPLGISTLRLIKNARGSLPQPRYLLDSGRLYFDTRDSLTYLDTNGSVEDVYQFEPEGVGNCVREGGCVSLVSAGRGPVDSNLLAIDASGDNVFFTARDRLVPADKDELIDLYDARVGGSEPPPSPQEGCFGETCQAPTAVPLEPSPSSQGSLGQQNYRPPKCPKGKVRRGGHCVKKHKAKAKKRKKRRAATANGRGSSR